MEEVDSIILHFLRELDVEIPDDIKGLTDLSPDIIVCAVSKCLNSINPTLKAPKSLPAGISHRIEVAAQMATMCKDLGYKSEVGYQTFLYYNEADLRNVFMFLIECLPTNTDQSVAPVLPTDSNSVMWQRIRNKIAEELNAIWLPPTCKPHLNQMGDGRTHDIDNNIYQDKVPGVGDAYIIKMFKKMKEIERKNTELDEVEITTVQKYSNNALKTNAEGSEHLPDNLPCSKILLKDLKEEAISLRLKCNSLLSQKKTFTTELSQIQQANENIDVEIKQFKQIKGLMEDLGVNRDAGMDEIMSKLKKDLEKLHMKIDECTHKNITLKGQIETVKRDLTLSDSEKNKRLRVLEELKATARQLKEEYKSKEQSNMLLRKEYEKLNRTGIKRSFYTKKIMEIIGNVAKQKIEVQKVLGDTRQIQKEINNLTGQLDRSFSVADETLFADAKKDDQSKKAYKLLALLHSECGAIVSLVNETGSLARELVDLEDHIEEAKSKRTEDTLKRVQSDLLQMQTEIESLECKK